MSRVFLGIYVGAVSFNIPPALDGTSQHCRMHLHPRYADQNQRSPISSPCLGELTCKACRPKAALASAGSHPTDVRMTTRFKEGDLTEGLTGAIHETGHALYEQGRNLAYDGLPVNQARSTHAATCMHMVLYDFVVSMPSTAVT